MRSEVVEWLVLIWFIPAFVLMIYGTWQTSKIRGSRGWAAHRTVTFLSFLWPLVLLLAAGNSVWTRVSKGRGSRGEVTAAPHVSRPRRWSPAASWALERLEEVLVVALGVFPITVVAVVGVLRLLGVRGLALVLTAIVLPVVLFVALPVMTSINDRRRR